MIIEEAFRKVCADSKSAEDHYVSLYERVPFYGGPEEGGWWGESVCLVAYQKFITKEDSEMALAAVKALAGKAKRESTEAWSRRCAAELDWLEARGLEPDYLPETAGASDFFATLEDEPGSLESDGSTHYE